MIKLSNGQTDRSGRRSIGKEQQDHEQNIKTSLVQELVQCQEIDFLVDRTDMNE